MKKPDDAVWEDIRRAYCASLEPVAAIAKRYGLQPITIHSRANRLLWKRLDASSGDTPKASVKAGTKATAKPLRSSKKAPAALLASAAPASNVIVLKRSAALTRTLVKRARERLADKLDNLRIQLTDGRRRKSTDSERESRDLLGIINGIAKTQEIENELNRNTDAAGAATGRSRAAAIDPADLADRADGLRRALADNIARRRKPQ